MRLFGRPCHIKPVGALSRKLVECTNERYGALTATQDRREPSSGGQLGSTIDGRNQQIELGTSRPSGQRHPNGMKQIFALLARSLLDLVRRRPEPLTIE